MSTLDDISKKLANISTAKETSVIPVVAEVIAEPVKKRKVGRPKVMTKEVCLKIEEVAALGGSVEEMAMYSGINRQTLYTYFKENPEYSDKIESLQERPILKARNTIVADLQNPETSKWYLERKKRKEFGQKVDMDVKIVNLNIDL